MIVYLDDETAWASIERVSMTDSERWKQLESRLDDKRAALQRMYLLAQTPKEQNRLRGKVDGLNLALSIVGEYTRGIW